MTVELIFGNDDIITSKPVLILMNPQQCKGGQLASKKPRIAPTFQKRQDRTPTRNDESHNAAVPFAVRVQPHSDEQLNSYLLRVTEANGLSSLTWTHVLRSPIGYDWDKNVSNAQLSLIEKVTGVPSSVLRGMTLRLDGNQLLEHESKLGIARHLLPILSNTDANDMPNGLQYCSDCLQQDRTPYLRKHWRYSFVAACASHRRLLRDSCPHCGTKFSPYRRDGDHKSFFQCSGCERDILDGIRPAQDLQLVDSALYVQNLLMESMASGWARLFGREIHCVPFFSGMRYMFKFALSGNFIVNGPKNFRYPGREWLLADYSLRLKRKNGESISGIRKPLFFELYSPEPRAIALSLVAQWLGNWPRSFAEVACSTFACRFRWREICSEAQRETMPYWLANGFSLSDAPTHTMTKRSVVEHARKKLTMLGFHDPSKSEIDRYLYEGVFPAASKRSLVDYILANKDARRRKLILSFKRKQATPLESMRRQLQNSQIRERNDQLKKELASNLRKRIEARIQSIFFCENNSLSDFKPLPRDRLIDRFSKYLDIDEVSYRIAIKQLRDT